MTHSELVARAVHKGHIVNPIKLMKQNTLTVENFESTYALLVRSEEKERNLFESVAYLVLILSAVFSICYMAQQPVGLPISHAKAIPTNSETCQRA